MDRDARGGGLGALALSRTAVGAALECGAAKRAGVGGAARLDQLARLGPAGLPYLVRAMDDPRESVAQRARRTVWDAIRGWEKLPPRDAALRLRTLADALDARVESFGPAAQWEAGQIAVRLLQWPLDGTPDGRHIVAACERILAHTEASLHPDADPTGVSARRSPATSDVA